jgi:hypothetical protein
MRAKASPARYGPCAPQNEAACYSYVVNCTVRDFACASTPRTCARNRDMAFGDRGHDVFQLSDCQMVK